MSTLEHAAIKVGTDEDELAKYTFLQQVRKYIMEP